MRECAEAVNSRALLTDKPLENVDIVAALCKQHGRTVGFLMPVSASEAVAVVDMSNALIMVDVHDLADLTLINESFESSKEGSEVNREKLIKGFSYKTNKVSEDP